MRSSGLSIKPRLTALIAVSMGSTLMIIRPQWLPNRLESPILILEDEEATMEGLKPALEGEGIATQCAHDGWDAINRIIDALNVPHEGA